MQRLYADRLKSWLEHERLRPQWSLPRRGRNKKYQISKNHVGETQTMATVDSFVFNSQFHPPTKKLTV